VGPTHYELSSDLILPSVVAERFSKTLSDYLGSEDVFKEKGDSGGKRVSRDWDTSDEALLNAKKEKKRLKKISSWKKSGTGPPVCVL
jgi:hypothetical protein